jgi:hypothetical protein
MFPLHRFFLIYHNFVGSVSFVAPVVEETPTEPDPAQPEIFEPDTSRSKNDGGLRTSAILAMSVGGALLIVGAGVLRRRKLKAAGDLSAMDSTSVQPTGDEAA